MGAEQKLIDAIRDEPDSVEPGLVYADWLEEWGDPRAELVRVQMALRGPVDAADCPVLRAQERLLTKQLRGEILGPVRSLTKCVEFFHGLILPELSSDVFLKNADAILHQSPTLGVRFTKLKARGVADCPELKSLRAVSLRGNSTQSARAALLESMHLTELRAIEPGDAGMRPEFARAWCTDKWPHLTRAVLQSGAKIDLAEMLAAPQMKRLRHLSLLYLELSDSAVFLDALSDGDTAPALETFDPGQLFAQDHNWSRFCSAVHLPSVRKMDLSDDFSSPQDLQNLLSNKGLPRLEELAVLTTDAKLLPETFSSRPPRSLTRLGIRQCQFTEASAIALGESRLFRQLQSLRIAPGNLGRHLKAMRKAGVVAKKMRVLELANTRPTVDDISILQELFPNLETLAIDCSAAAARELAQLSMPKLRRLHLGDFTLTPAIVKTLVNAPWFSRLETLNLYDLVFHDEALAALADYAAEHPLKLRVLALGDIGTSGARVLSDSDAFRNLDFLSFFSNKIGKPTLRRVRQKYGTVYEGGWPAVAKTLGGFVPEFFVKHPFGGIV